MEESTNTLRYAERARNIKKSVTRNVISKSLSPAEAAALKRENQTLKLQVMQLEAKLKSSLRSSLDKSSIYENDSVQNKVSSDNFDFGKLEIVTRLHTYCTSLKSKIEKLESQIQANTEDIISASLRADQG